MMQFTRRHAIKLAFALAAMAHVPANAQDQQKVLLLVNGSLGDKSFFDSAAHGLQMIKEKYGDAVKTQVLEIGDDPTKWEPALLDASEGDWSLIIAGTFAMSETVGEVAKQYPNKKYVLYDASLPFQDGGFDNVYSILYKQNEGSYLAGVLAAGLLKAGVGGTPTDQIGFLGGMDIPVINDFLLGYLAGAQSILPNIKAQISYAGSFNDAAKGKDLALAQFKSGVSIGFNAASQTGLGLLSAAKETGKLAIGVDSDQEAIFASSDPAIADKVVTSVLKNVDVSLLAAYEQFIAGELKFGTAQVVGLKEGAVGLAEGGAMKKIAPPDVIKAVEDAKAAIVAGTIVVPTGFGLTAEHIAAVREKVRP